MSTGTSQGYDVAKPTSKVLAPPGGRSSGNILGGYEEPEETKPARKGPISNVFGSGGAGGAGDDDAQQQANKNKARAQESSQNRLFGGNDDDSKPIGKGKGGEKEKEEEEKNGEAESNDKKDESQTQATPSPSQKGRASYNPITNEDNADSPKPAETAQKAKRQPPGGYSAGLW